MGNARAFGTSVGFVGEGWPRNVDGRLIPPDEPKSHLDTRRENPNSSRWLRGYRRTSKKPPDARGDSGVFHLGHVSGSGETDGFKYSAAQCGFMQKIAESATKAGKVEHVGTRASATSFMNALIVDAAIRSYHAGNKNVRLSIRSA